MATVNNPLFVTSLPGTHRVQEFLVTQGDLLTAFFLKKGSFCFQPSCEEAEPISDVENENEKEEDEDQAENDLFDFKK